MFDITAFIREKIFKRKKIVSEFSWEELSEKETTKLWYFLLYCMFLAIIISAQWTLDIIYSISDRPRDIPYCIDSIVKFLDDKEDNTNSYSNYKYDYNYDNNNCKLESSNPKFDFNNEYISLKIPYNGIIEISKTIDKLNSQKRDLENKEINSRENYNTSLSEKIAWENSWLYDKNSIQENIKTNNSEIVKIESQIDSLNLEINNIKLKYAKELSNIKQKIDKTEDDYNNSYLLYKFYIAFLSFLYSISVFTILYKIYIRQKVKNSPYTIIFSIATFAYGLILLQVLFLFVYDIIPPELLEIIHNLLILLNIYKPLLYIVQFLRPILIIFTFWILVYKIQKRLYSSKNILKRFISDKKCPSCWNWVDITKAFCPLCSYEIRIHCHNCNELTLKWMPFCSSCWGKLDDSEILSFKKE